MAEELRVDDLSSFAGMVVALKSEAPVSLQPDTAGLQRSNHVISGTVVGLVKPFRVHVYSKKFVDCRF